MVEAFREEASASVVPEEGEEVRAVSAYRAMGSHSSKTQFCSDYPGSSHISSFLLPFAMRGGLCFRLLLQPISNQG